MKWSKKIQIQYNIHFVVVKFMRQLNENVLFKFAKQKYVLKMIHCHSLLHLISSWPLNFPTGLT